MTDYPFAFPPNEAQQLAIPHIDTENNIVLSFGTGVGKTAIAEAAAYEHLKKGERVIFICPFRSLASEKLRDWENNKVLSPYGIQMRSGENRVSLEGLEKSKILIFTPEAFVIYAHELDYGLIIFDEFHLIADEDRGHTIEMAMIQGNAARFLCMSGTLPKNIDQVSDWISELTQRKTATIKSSYMPSKREVTISVCKKVKKQDPKIKWKSTYDYNYAEVVGIYKSRPTTGKTIAFVSSKRFGNEIESHFSKFTTSAFHHASIGKDARAKYEKDFLDGKIKVLFATTTLAAGVNLMADRILVLGVKKGQEYLNSFEIGQMIGRCGRVHGTTGYVDIIVDSDKQREEIKKIIENRPSVGSHSVAERLDYYALKYGVHEMKKTLCSSFGGYTLSDMEIDKICKSTFETLLLLEMIDKDGNKTDLGNMVSKTFLSPSDASSIYCGLCEFIGSVPRNMTGRLAHVLGDNEAVSKVTPNYQTSEKHGKLLEQFSFPPCSSNTKYGLVWIMAMAGECSLANTSYVKMAFTEIWNSSIKTIARFVFKDDEEFEGICNVVEKKNTDNWD